MNRKSFWPITFVCLVAGTLADAQQPASIPRIGFLVSSTPSNYVTRLETFRQAMRELGYVEGKNITIEYRFAEGKADRMREIAAEFVSMRLTSSLLPLTPRLQRTQQRQSQLSLLPLPTQSLRELWTAWPGRAETLLG